MSDRVANRDGVRRSRLAPVVAVVAACALAVGCARTQVKALPEVPLDVPAPPERSVQAIEPLESPIISLPEEPVRTPPPPRPRQTPTPRADNRPPDPRPELLEPAKPAEEAVKSPPATTLQTAPTQQEGEAERRVRAQLSQTTAALNRINVQSLNTDAREQLGTARRFVSQAEDALRTRNLVFATNLAEKASALALQLSGQ